MFALQNLEAGLGKGRGVFLKRGQITLFRVLFLAAELVPERAAKRGKAIIHVDHDTDAAGREQIENFLAALDLFVRAMAVTNRVYAQNDWKEFANSERATPSAAARSVPSVSFFAT